MKPRLKNLTLSTLALLAILIGCFASLVLYFGSLPNLRISFIEGCDPLFVSALIKIISTQTWWPGELIQSSQLATPFGFQLGDYPMGDLLQFFLLKLLNGLTKNPYETYSVYYLSSFVTVAMSFFFCARKLGASRWLCIPLTIAFTLLPFHFSRYAHVLFAQYVWVAPLALIAFLMALGQSPLSRRARWSTVSISVLASFCGIYYAFFFCFFLGLALLINTRHPGAKKHWVSFSIILALMMGFGSLNYISNFRYTAIYGKTNVSVRHVFDDELGGFRLATFLLPTHQTVIEPLRTKIQNYLDILSSIEGKNEYGGALAVMFLLISVSAVVLVRSRRALRQLGLLNLGAILFATVGGLNIVFGLFVTPSFRSENRVSVFIACFALFAAAIVLKRTTRRWPIWLQAGFALALSVVVILDQTPVQGTGLSPQSKTAFDIETRFFRNIEATCAADSKILQLPFTEFPEAPAVGKMLPYEHLKAYLSTDHLRWSYGVMREREGTAVLRKVSQLPLDLEQIHQAGFSGVEIDTVGYEDIAPTALESLKKTLGPSLFMSENGRYFFFAVPGAGCT